MDGQVFVMVFFAYFEDSRLNTIVCAWLFSRPAWLVSHPVSVALLDRVVASRPTSISPIHRKVPPFLFALINESLKMKRLPVARGHHRTDHGVRLHLVYSQLPVHGAEASRAQGSGGCRHRVRDAAFLFHVAGELTRTHSKG